MVIDNNSMFNFKDVKVLIVDDEEYLREILLEAFTLYGADVSLANSGHEALQKNSENDYDIVISDLRMPNGDGITLFSGINKMNKPLPLLFACSAFNDLTAENMKKLHVLKVFNKPFEIEGMLKCIYSYLKNN